jgi:hypothetical protein
VHSCDVSHAVLFVDHNRHVVGEARGEEGQEKNKRANSLKFHKHIRFQAFVTREMSQG